MPLATINDVVKLFVGVRYVSSIFPQYPLSLLIGDCSALDFAIVNQQVV